MSLLCESSFPQNKRFLIVVAVTAVLAQLNNTQDIEACCVPAFSRLLEHHVAV